MQEIKLKKDKHLVVIKVPPNMSYDAMDKLSTHIRESMPGINVMVVQAETEMTVITLED